eukprot:11176347-Lingulodinium_polyedra.AAC.1
MTAGGLPPSWRVVSFWHTKCMPSPPSGMHSAPGSRQPTAAMRMSGAGVTIKSMAHSLANAQTAAA